MKKVSLEKGSFFEIKHNYQKKINTKNPEMKL